MVEGNTNSTSPIFSGSIVFNNLVTKICWMNHSTFLSYYGIGLNNHSARLWIGYSTHLVIEKKIILHLIPYLTPLLHCNFCLIWNFSFHYLLILKVNSFHLLHFNIFSHFHLLHFFTQFAASNARVGFLDWAKKIPHLQC